MVKRIKLSQETTASVLRDVLASCGKDVTGDLENTPVFVILPLDENQVLVGLDPTLEEVGFRDQPLVPLSLISAAFFVGEGSHVYHMTIDGVRISIKGRH